MARFLVWLVVAWPTPALVAGALGWKGVWGSGSALLDYLSPLPISGGVLHVMTLTLVSVLLATQARWPGILPGLARAILLGFALAGVALLLDIGRIYQVLTTDAALRRLPWQENPVGLFLLCDALLAQFFAGIFGGRWPQGAKEWLLSMLATATLPALAAGAMLSLDSRTGQPFLYTGSRQGPGRNDESIYVFTQQPATTPNFRQAAAAFAAQWDPRNNINTEDVAVLFIPSLEAARRFDGKATALTYCMYQDGTPPAWLPGKGDCFGPHDTIAERSQRFFEAQDRALPQEERLRNARVQACAGARAQAGAADNFMTRYCGRN
jgi:hypothetical protein